MFSLPCGVITAIPVVDISRQSLPVDDVRTKGQYTRATALLYYINQWRLTINLHISHYHTPGPPSWGVILNVWHTRNCWREKMQ